MAQLAAHPFVIGTREKLSRPENTSPSQGSAPWYCPATRIAHNHSPRSKT